MSEQEMALEKVERFEETPETSLVLTPVMNIAVAKARLAEFQEFVSGYLSESNDGGEDGGDYGIIPGTKKKTLLKSGAEKLCEIYGLTDDYTIDSKVENFDTGLFYYQIKCTLRSRRDGSIVGTGLGSCSSYESKFRWRDSQRKCPKCHKTNIRKGKGDSGWYCWAKTGGCGSKFKEGDSSIETQVIGRVENPDIIDIANTVLKIAKKRSKIDVVISVTRSSGIFTQDLEDMPTKQESIHGPSQDASQSRQDDPGDDPFGPGVSDAYPGPKTPPAPFRNEIEVKKAELAEVMNIPCFTDDHRTVMADNAAKCKTLEGINKLLSHAMDHAKKSVKAQIKAEKQANLQAQLEISQEENYDNAS